MNKIKKLIEEYGRLALILHIILFLLVFMIMFCVVEFGFRDLILAQLHDVFGEEYAQAGTWVVVYAATKITQPIRIVLMIFLLPILKQKMFKEGHSIELSNEE